LASAFRTAPAATGKSRKKLFHRCHPRRGAPPACGIAFAAGGSGGLTAYEKCLENNKDDRSLTAAGVGPPPPPLRTPMSSEVSSLQRSAALSLEGGDTEGNSEQPKTCLEWPDELHPEVRAGRVAAFAWIHARHEQQRSLGAGARPACGPGRPQEALIRSGGHHHDPREATRPPEGRRRPHSAWLTIITSATDLEHHDDPDHRLGGLVAAVAQAGSSLLAVEVSRAFP